MMSRRCLQSFGKALRVRGIRREFHRTTAYRGLLKGIDPVLNADLLYALRTAGHGDEIAIVDCNFPAYATAHTADIDPIILSGVDAVTALDAVCSVLPLDYFEDSVFHMSPEDGDALPPLAAEVHEQGNAAIQEHAAGITVKSLPRFEFYERANDAFAIVQAGSERRPYGNWILKKGVVGPDGKDLKP